LFGGNLGGPAQSILTSNPRPVPGKRRVIGFKATL